jgi:hypothetical protein
MTIKATAYGPGDFRIEIDGGDPDTPAMVYLKTPRGEASATFQCAFEGGVLTTSDYSEFELDARQILFLEGFEDQVDAAFDEARAGLPEYGN